MNIFEKTIGDRDLCAWQVARGVTWVQTRNADHARRLAKRSDSKLVAYGVKGGYLKTFEFNRPLSWSERLINRYKSKVKAANTTLI